MSHILSDVFKAFKCGYGIKDFIADEDVTEHIDGYFFPAKDAIEFLSETGGGHGCSFFGEEQMVVGVSFGPATDDGA